jgi:cation:H+ antiporter
MSKKEKAKDQAHEQKEMEAEFGSKKELKKTRLFSLFLVIAGLIALVWGSKLFVDAAVSLARQWGVSELIIGLTIVAAGTSLPEVATSIMAAIKGERDIAVGNVVGSNIFNILGVLGLSGILSPSGLSVAAEAQAFDIPVMTAVAVACLPIFFTGNLIKRWEGALFLAYYIFYTTFIVLVASKSSYADNLKDAMMYFVIPLTVLTLMIAVSRSFFKRKSLL